MPAARMMHDAPLVAAALNCDAGRNRVLRDVDLSVSRTEVSVVLGPQGAGKTALVRCLVGLVPPCRGKVRLFGHDPTRTPGAVRRRVAYLPQKLRLYRELRVGQILRFTRSFYPDWDVELTEHLLARFDLSKKARLDVLPLAARRRLGLVLCLGQRADLLVLDEPGAGLNAASRCETIELVVRQALATGTALLFTSPTPADLAGLDATISILCDGELRLHGRPTELVEHTREIIVKDTENPPRDLPLPSRLLDSWSRAGRRHMVVTEATPELLQALHKSTGSPAEIVPLTIDRIYRACTSRAGTPRRSSR